MIEEQPNVYQMGLQELWNWTNTLVFENEMEESPIFDMIKNGFQTKFHVEYIINEWYEIYPGANKARIRGQRKKLKITDFFDEIRKREAAMRSLILENTREDEMISPRGDD